LFRTIFIFLSLLTYSLAHPHTFIDVYPKVSHSANQITTIHFSWKFDVMISEMYIMEFDENDDGKLDAKENQYIKKSYFDTMRDFSFYTHIRIKKEPIITKASNFKASIDSNKRVVYQFDIEINANKSDIEMDFYDEDNYVAFILKQEFVNSTTPFQVSTPDGDYIYKHRLQFKP